MRALRAAARGWEMRRDDVRRDHPNLRGGGPGWCRMSILQRERREIKLMDGTGGGLWGALPCGGARRDVGRGVAEWARLDDM